MGLLDTLKYCPKGTLHQHWPNRIHHLGKHEFPLVYKKLTSLKKPRVFPIYSILSLYLLITNGMVNWPTCDWNFSSENTL